MGSEIEAHGSDCLASCKNFQETLSSCVAKLLFEPGQVAGMGAPDPAAPKPADICTQKDTPCLPDLEQQYQNCLKDQTAAVLKGSEVGANEKRMCKTMKSDLEDCKGCPQMSLNGASE